jgi:molecular chaperone DnaK (HSP70)
MTRTDKTRYAIGIDLGTTNCALSFLESGRTDSPVSFEIPQRETESSVVRSRLLPSFFYLPQKAEWKRGQLRHDWSGAEETPDFAVGRYARSLAATQPGRVIHSAKSWICHGGVSREDRILPWHSDELIGDDRRSPVEVSAAYLQYLRQAWNHAHVGDDSRLERQTVTITVPASFDEAAQMLTVRAAEQAGFSPERIHLLEEPQAAFYSWLRQKDSPAELEQLLGDDPAKTVLICDIGGGTSDFSLFRVSRGATKPGIERIAVSEHLLLGGDNIDLAIAHILEGRLTKTKLSSRQWAQLVSAARELKERALSDKGSPEEELHVALAGEGSSLFARTLSAGILRSEVLAVVLEGFFPSCARDAVPQVQASGLKTLGLPYAQDSAVTRYLAAFVGGQPIDAVLFTGGSLTPVFLQEHIHNVIAGWQESAPRLLANHDMDLAVAHGAAAFSATFSTDSEAVDRHERIKAGYPRSLYLELASGSQAAGPSLLCVVPKGFDGHQPLRIDNLAMQARLGAPVRFQLFSSLHRESDRPGDLLKLHEAEFHPLSPLHTVLRAKDSSSSQRSGTTIDVALEVILMSTGMLQLFCVDRASGERWQLEFNVRDLARDDAAQYVGDTEIASSIDKVRYQKGLEKFEEHFGKKKKSDSDQDNPKYLVRTLEEIFGCERKDWDVSTLRRMWPTLREGMTRKSRSIGHEVSWLYLAGYALRPGYGVELDEWRVSELWKAYELGLAFPKERQAEEQWWIMWRRVAGGLSREQQEKIFDKIFPAIRKGNVPSSEIYMLAGSLERIEMGNKVRLGNYLVQQISEGRKQFLDQKFWALARIASRVLMHGSAESIVRPSFVEDWFSKLRGLSLRDKQYARLATFMAQAGRLVNDREFDLPPEIRSAMISLLEKSGIDETQIRPLREFVPADAAAKSQLFGEELPAGLILRG